MKKSSSDKYGNDLGLRVHFPQHYQEDHKPELEVFVAELEDSSNPDSYENEIDLVQEQHAINASREQDLIKYVKCPVYDKEYTIVASFRIQGFVDSWESVDDEYEQDGVDWVVEEETSSFRYRSQQIASLHDVDQDDQTDSVAVEDENIFSIKIESYYGKKVGEKGETKEHGVLHLGRFNRIVLVHDYLIDYDPLVDDESALVNDE